MRKIDGPAAEPVDLAGVAGPAVDQAARPDRRRRSCVLVFLVRRRREVIGPAPVATETSHRRPRRRPGAARPRAAGRVLGRRPRRRRRTGRHRERAVPRRRHADADAVLADRARRGPAVGRLEADGGVGPPRPRVDPADLAAAHRPLRRRARRRRSRRSRRAAPDAAASAAPGPASSACTPTGPGTWPAATIRSVAGSPSELDAAGSTSPIDASTVDRQPSAAGDFRLPVGPGALLADGLADPDPPTAGQLTNALGAVADHLDDVVRAAPGRRRRHRRARRAGHEPWHLAIVERGAPDRRPRSPSNAPPPRTCSAPWPPSREPTACTILV